MRPVPFRRVLTSLALFTVLCVVIVVMDRRSLLDPVREGMAQVMSPAVTRFEGFLQPEPSDSAVQQELATAVAERDSLRSENARLQGELREVEALREQVRVEQQRPNLDVLRADVIRRDVSGTQQFMIINRGSADGLRVGMAVVDPNYYVGQLVEVDQHESKVLLIIDATANVGAVMYDSHADGIVYGNGSGMLTVEHLHKEVQIGASEWVLTSNLIGSETAQVPPDLPIGWVIGEPTINAQTDELEVTIQPAADFSELDTVWIVVPKDE